MKLRDDFSANPSYQDSCNCNYTYPEDPHSNPSSEGMIRGWKTIEFDMKSKILRWSIIETEVG